MENLESRLQLAFDEHHIEGENQLKIRTFLEPLKLKDIPSYEHSLRVGLLASSIAEYLHLDSKALLYAGLLHDVGKLLIRPETLKKTEGFGPADAAEMQHHSEYSHRILSGIYDFSADIAVRHHYYQERGYPETLPPLRHPYSKATQATIDYYALLLSLADFYDAASMRVNDKHGEKRRLTKTEVKQLLNDKQPHFRKLIDELYRNQIFEDEPINATGVQDELSRAANVVIPYRTPREVRRNIQSALALEPLSEKPGCTTRSSDCSRHLKLEYFVIGAINVGDAFEDMAERILGSDSQPLLYDLAERAQLECKRNRDGGRINHGMLEMLTPIIAAQLIYDKNRQLSVDEVLNRTYDILQNTSSQDVKHLLGLKRLAYDLSAYDDRQLVDHDATTVFNFYQHELSGSEKLVSKLHNAEFVNAFPAVRAIYHELADVAYTDLSKRVKEAYVHTRAGIHAGLEAGGLTADCCGVALYLLLSHHPSEIIVR